MASVNQMNTIKSRQMAIEAWTKLFSGYGSFFGFCHPLSRFFLIAATLFNPAAGLSGMAGALIVISVRTMLEFDTTGETVEVVNGLLFGMLIGSLYKPCPASLLLLILGSALIVALAAVLRDTLTRQLRLPVLGLPYVASAYLMIPLAVQLQLAPAQPAFSLNSLPLLVGMPGGQIVTAWAQSILPEAQLED